MSDRHTIAISSPFHRHSTNYSHKKTAFKGGFTTLLIIDFILLFPW
jgi:hypothetical protein